MKNNIIIGEKANRKKIVAKFIFFIFYGLIGGIGVFGLSKMISNLNIELCIILGLTAFLITMMIVVPFASISEYMEIDNIYIKYYYYKNYIQRLIQTFSILLGKQEKPKIQIQLNEIESIKLSYESFKMLWAQKGYMLKIQFTLKDKSSILIYPSGTKSMKNKDYEKLFILLENNNIEIIDTYKLREALKKNGLFFFNYIESIDKN